MNTREQLLQKRIQSLEGQLHAAMQVMDVMDETYTLLGSVACGFAWDLSQDMGNEDPLYIWEHSEKCAEALVNLERAAERLPTQANDPNVSVP